MSRAIPVIAIGTGANGQEGVRSLLAAMPIDIGGAFVVVAHAQGDEALMTADLLAGCTAMPIVDATPGVPLAANQIHVLPSGRRLILDRRRHLVEESGSGAGVRLPVDRFLRALAETFKERAVAILLSGTEGDGALGIKEIKAAGGMVMVERGAMEHGGNPAQPGLAPGSVDYSLPIQEMPARLTGYVRHPYLEQKHQLPDLSLLVPEQFLEVMRLLHAHTSHDFRSYKIGTLNRRILRRMSLRQIEHLGDYLQVLRQDEKEVQSLYRDLLIRVTRFFRDPGSWLQLSRVALAPLINRKTNDEPLRVWIPGCATGEEAYTLSMLIAEQVAAQHKTLDMQIFATDLDEDAIATARAGIYSESVASDIGADRLQRFFKHQDGNCLVNKRLRDGIVFATQNLLADPPFSKLDIISCRNLMIYLQPEAQCRLIETFHFALAPGGCLFLGSSESADRPPGLFDPVSATDRIYRRSRAKGRSLGSLPGFGAHERADNRQAAKSGRGECQFPSTVELARGALLERFVPAAILVNRRSEIQYLHGPLRNYLDFPSGEPTKDLPSMAIDGLRGTLTTVLSQVQHRKRPAEAVASNVRRNGQHVSVRIRAEPLPPQAEREPLVLVYFQDEPAPSRPDEVARDLRQVQHEAPDEALLHQLEYELSATREDLQSTIEELETSNEELKVSNEEIMSINEELQSANEELESSREELQSLNEELSTVNRQLEEKVGELESTNNDLTNLLTSTDIATIFVDKSLRIRRFNSASSQLLRVHDSDLGQPVDDLGPRINDLGLHADARQVLEDLLPREAPVRTDVSTAFMRRIRPYRTADNAIEGVVVTYTDVTSLQQITDRLAARERQQAAVIRIGDLALGGAPLQDLLDQAAAEVAAQLNVSLTKILELLPDGSKLKLRAGVGWNDGLVGNALVDAGIRSQAGFTLQRSSATIVENLLEERRFTSAALLTDHGVVSGISVVIGPLDAPWGVLGAHERQKVNFTVDDTYFLQAAANSLWLAISRQRARAAIEAERLELRQLADALPFKIAIVDSNQRYLFNNRAYELWGMDPETVKGMHLRDLLGEDSYNGARQAIEQALAGEPQSFHLDVHHPGQPPAVNLVLYAPRRNAEGNLDGMYSASIDITELRRAEAAAAESERRLNLALDGARMGTWEWDPTTDDAKWDDRLGRIIGLADESPQQGTSIFSRIHPDDRTHVQEAIQECIGGSGVYRTEFRVMLPEGGVRWLAGYGARFDIQGRPQMAGVHFDVSDRKTAEERNKVISAELDHRVKNILATVISIARLTGRHARSITEFRGGFEMRIQAMSRTHSVLASSNWDGVELKDLLGQELAPYADQNGVHLIVDGPNVQLIPRSAQTLSMVFHELVTNAAKYGALAQEGGELDIRWRIEPHDDQPLFFLAWQENLARETAPPTSRGFGSTVIEDVVQSQLLAEVDWRFYARGMSYALRVPLGQLSR